MIAFTLAIRRTKNGSLICFLPVLNEVDWLQPQPHLQLHVFYTASPDTRSTEIHLTKGFAFRNADVVLIMQHILFKNGWSIIKDTRTISNGCHMLFMKLVSKMKRHRGIRIHFKIETNFGLGQIMCHNILEIKICTYSGF